MVWMGECEINEWKIGNGVKKLMEKIELRKKLLRYRLKISSVDGVNLLYSVEVYNIVNMPYLPSKWRSFYYLTKSLLYEFFRTERLPVQTVGYFWRFPEIATRLKYVFCLTMSFVLSIFHFKIELYTIYFMKFTYY